MVQYYLTQLLCKAHPQDEGMEYSVSYLITTKTPHGGKPCGAIESFSEFHNSRHGSLKVPYGTPVMSGGSPHESVTGRQ